MAGGKSFKKQTGPLNEPGKGKGGGGKPSRPAISPVVAIVAIAGLGVAGYLAFKASQPGTPPPDDKPQVKPAAVATVIPGPNRASGDVFAADSTGSATDSFGAAPRAGATGSHGQDNLAGASDSAAAPVPAPAAATY